MPTEVKKTDYVSDCKLFQKDSDLTIARLSNIEPCKVFIHRLTAQYFATSTSYPDPLVQLIAKYTLEGL